jgi:subtilisin family serine protease
MKQVQLTAVPRSRSKLDPRLATLVGLGVEAFTPAGLANLERADLENTTPRDPSGLLRAGPLAFLRRRRGGFEVARVPPAGPGAAPRTEVPLEVPVFLRTTSRAALDRLAASGIRLISRATTIATADVRLDQLPALEADDEVIAIEWTGAFRPLSEGAGAGVQRGACAAIGLDPAQLGNLDGRGCVVGVVDVEGIDLYHPCFVTSRGRTRLLALWDQRATPGEGLSQSRVERGPGGFGVVHRRDAIGLEISPHQLMRHDVVDHRALKGSHGTITSALAVGLGEDRPDARGTAPGADLVFVSTFGSGPGALGAMTELADAIAFVLAEADALGKPCVVNVSLGDDLGPRDGTSPVESFIDELLEIEGRAIVIAAGNSQGKKRHAAAMLQGGETVSFGLVVAPRNTERAVVEIWYEAGEEAFSGLSFELEAPGDGGRSPAIEADGIPRAFDAGTTRVLAISMARHPGPASSGKRNGVIRVELLPPAPGGALLAGTWRFHVRALAGRFAPSSAPSSEVRVPPPADPRAQGRGGAVHAWVDHRYAHWENASDSLTLTTPATARKAIVVGAYDAETDDVACFSGRGEDRGGLRRPDVLAPGVSLVGAWAESPVRYIASANGTSVAAPIVAGVAALIFQQAAAKLSASVVRERVLELTRPTAGGQRTVWLADLAASPVVTASPERVAVLPAEVGPRPAERRSQRPLPRVRPADAAQIIQGRYKIYLEGQPVGAVLVVPADRPGATVEHWVLGPRFTPPSAERRSVALLFEYAGKPVALERFLAGLPAGSQYVRAACEIAPGVRLRAADKIAELPSMAEGIDTTAGSTGTMTKNYMRPLDRTQIIQGRYMLYQGLTEVGALYVTDDSPGVSTEHWLLYEEYAWPSESNTVQEIRFEYKTTMGSLESFLTDPPSNTTYVIASCEQQTLP